LKKIKDTTTTNPSSSDDEPIPQRENKYSHLNDANLNFLIHRALNKNEDGQSINTADDNSEQHELAETDDFEMKIAFTKFDARLSQILFSRFSFSQSLDNRFLFQKHFFEFPKEQLEYDSNLQEVLDFMFLIDEEKVKEIDPGIYEMIGKRLGFKNVKTDKDNQNTQEDD
jgi:hypothetical protein